MIYTAKPNRGAVLRAIVLPSQGGHTGFADQQLAYDALSPSTKAQIDDLKVVYRFEVNLFNMPFLDTRGYDPGPNGPKSPADLGFPDFPDALYPLVLTHPVTGRRSLNVCPMFMERVYEYDREEGDALLRELVTHVTSPSFSYLHHWEEGDMVLWDNWRMMHCASGIHPGDQRVIYRTTIAGDSVLGTQLPKVS
jgi:taurine dioxygenase